MSVKSRRVMWTVVQTSFRMFFISDFFFFKNISHRFLRCTHQVICMLQINPNCEYLILWKMNELISTMSNPQF